MSRIRIDENERYPFYSVTDRYGEEVEATDEQVTRWAAAMEAFEAAQDEMEALYNAAAKAAREEQERVKAEREATAKAERERLERQRGLEAKAMQTKINAMWARIEASGGVVYDADGKRIGEIRAAGLSGVRLEP